MSCSHMSGPLLQPQALTLGVSPGWKPVAKNTLCVGHISASVLGMTLVSPCTLIEGRPSFIAHATRDRSVYASTSHLGQLQYRQIVGSSPNQHLLRNVRMAKRPPLGHFLSVEVTVVGFEPTTFGL